MICKKCNQEFIEKYSEWSKGDFCSKQCARSYATQNDKKEFKKVKCITCNKEIEVDKRASSKLCKCDDCRKPLGRKKIKCENCNILIFPNKNNLCRECKKIKEKFCSCGKKINKYSKTNLCHKCWTQEQVKKKLNKWLKDGNIKLASRPRGYIRDYVFDRQDGKCLECNMSDMWNNKKIIFILDHIDGNSENNAPENLRMICPNCDSQLPTFKNKNKGKGRKYDKEYRKRKYNHGRVAEPGLLR